MTDTGQSWALNRGAIYRDTYEKRIDERQVDTTAPLQRARVEGNDLCFASAEAQDAALSDGVFLLDIPADVDTTAGDLFASQFFRGEAIKPYGRFRSLTCNRFDDPLLGFHERINQIEQFLLERRFWHRDYPTEIAGIGEAVTRLTQTVLRAILRLTDIPAESWSTATGGCSEGAGSYHLTFNHYRPSFPGVGLSSHKDDGFMTILRTTAPGLEVNRCERWEAVEATPSTFVVNFGLSMEVLTRKCRKPIAAIMHRVRHQTNDRFSFGHFSSSFCEPGAAAGIYSFDSATGLRRVCSSRELIDANDEEIYFGTYVPEGNRE